MCLYLRCNSFCLQNRCYITMLRCHQIKWQDSACYYGTNPVLNYPRQIVLLCFHICFMQTHWKTQGLWSWLYELCLSVCVLQLIRELYAFSTRGLCSNPSSKKKINGINVFIALKYCYIFVASFLRNNKTLQACSTFPILINFTLI